MPQQQNPGYEFIEDDPSPQLGYEFIHSEEDEDLDYEMLDEQGGVISQKDLQNTPQYIANLMADPEFVPTMEQFQQYKKYENDVPWAEVLSATRQYFGELLANGIEDLGTEAEEKGLLAVPGYGATAVEAFMQGNRGLYQIISQSQDPNSWAFKTKKAVIEAYSGTHDGSVTEKMLAKTKGAGLLFTPPTLMLDAINYFKGKNLNGTQKQKLRDKSEYMQFILAREWAKETLKLEKGETNLIGEALHSYGVIERDTINKLPIQGRAAAMLGMGFDLSTFAGGTIVTEPGKAMAKQKGKG